MKSIRYHAQSVGQRTSRKLLAISNTGSVEHIYISETQDIGHCTTTSHATSEPEYLVLELEKHDLASQSTLRRYLGFISFFFFLPSFFLSCTGTRVWTWVIGQTGLEIVWRYIQFIILSVRSLKSIPEYCTSMIFYCSFSDPPLIFLH